MVIYFELISSFIRAKINIVTSEMRSSILSVYIIEPARILQSPVCTLLGKSWCKWHVVICLHSCCMPEKVVNNNVSTKLAVNCTQLAVNMDQWSSYMAAYSQFIDKNQDRVYDEWHSNWL